MRKVCFKFFTAVLFVGVLSNGALLFAKWEVGSPSDFRLSDKVTSQGIKDWISIKRFGIEDKPFPEFVLVFTTGTPSAKYEVSQDSNWNEYVVVKLPKKEEKQLLEFVGKKDNSVIDWPKNRTFVRVQRFAGAVLIKAYYMEANQALPLFKLLDNVFKKYPKLSVGAPESCNRMIKDLSFVQKR